MKNLVFYIQSEPTNEPVKINIKVGVRQFSEVKLYVPKDENGKISVAPGKRWYVYFYYRNPLDNKMQKFKFYCDINTYKTVQERKETGKAWVEAYMILLNQGFNPFSKMGIEPKTFDQTVYTVKTGLEYAYSNKLGTWKSATADDYKTRLGVFMEWVYENKLEEIDIRDLEERHLISFMNWLILPKPKGRGVGKTSQDNYKRCLSGLFSKLVKDKIVSKNILAEIETTKDDPIKNTPFTGYEVKKIRDYLLEHDKQLYHYIQFVIYAFLRPREIIRLTVEDINFNEKYLKVETKTKRKQIKKIIGPLLDYLRDINIEALPAKAHLFTNTGEFDIWDASEKSKTDHFALRFRKVKKVLGFNQDYGLYSFRHTAALDLFNGYIKTGLTEREAILKLMPITGHSTETALRNYLRDVGGMLPKDYGADYTLEF